MLDDIPISLCFYSPRAKPPFPPHCLPHQMLHLPSLALLTMQRNLLHQIQWLDTKQDFSKYLTKNAIFFHMETLSTWSKLSHIAHIAKPLIGAKRKNCKLYLSWNWILKYSKAPDFVNRNFLLNGRK